MMHPSPAAPFAMELKVRYVECDMQGRVFNAHYLTWVDMAHTEAIDELLGGYQEVLAAYEKQSWPPWLRAKLPAG